MRKKSRFMTVIFTLVSSLIINNFSIVARASEVSKEELLMDDAETIARKREMLEYKELSRTIREDKKDIYTSTSSFKYDYKDPRIQYDNFLEYYSNYFNFNSEYVINSARYLTDDYKSVDNLFLGNQLLSLENPEEFAIEFIYMLYNDNLEEFEIYSDDARIEKELVLPEIDEEGKIIISNEIATSATDYIGYIAQVEGIDINLAKSISDYETGYQTNDQVINKNNYGGLMGSKGSLTFPTPEAGMICFTVNVKRLLSLYEYDNLLDFSGMYTQGTISLPSESWTSGVKYIYNDYSNKSVSEYTFKLN